MSELKNIIAQKLNIGHFLLVFLLTSAFSIGLLMLSFLLGWLFFMESASGRMFSNWTLFGLFTTDISLLLLVLFGLFKDAKRKEKFDSQKSYVIMGIILIVAYLVFMPYILVTNV